MEGSIDNELGARIADALVKLCASNGMTLDFSPESLVTLDALLKPFDSAGATDNEGLIEASAAYYGEVIRRTFGGDWRFEIPPDGDWGLECPSDSGQMVWCASTVHKHFTRGGKSLAAIFNVIAANFDHPPIALGDAASTPAAKKPSAATKKPAAAKKPAATKKPATATKKPAAATKKPAAKKKTVSE